LVESFTKTKIIVTSRPPAAKEGWLSREGFTEFDLEPMDLANIDKFLKHWHDAVREELQFDPENAAKLDDLESSLRDMLRQNRALRNLATKIRCCAHPFARCIVIAKNKFPLSGFVYMMPVAKCFWNAAIKNSNSQLISSLLC
jgi:hypothetical protein